MCKVCPNKVLESLQHCLFECAKAKHTWEAYFRVWRKWGALDNVAFSWPFILLGELVFEREDDPPNIQGYHIGGFSYIRHQLEILKSFILYFLWSKICKMHFDAQYSSRDVLLKLGWPPLRLGWPPGEPSTPSNPHVNLVFGIGSIKPLRWNGAI
jgi:hypothetical protein